MKKILTDYLGALALGTILTTTVLAQAVVRETTTTTNTVGTISEIGPEQIVIRSETAPEPVRYIARSTTTYVDETGAPVSIETVKSGLPATVYYQRDGDRLVATRVVVRRAVVAPAPAPATVIEKKTTTTTTTDK
jgi:hypothetical protein